MNEESKWITVKEAATYLKVSQMTLFRWMKSGKITHYKMGSSVRLIKEDLDALAKPSLAHDEQKNSDEAIVSASKKEEHCQMCGFDSLIDGNMQSTGRLYFKPLKTRFWTFTESTIPITAKMCTRCGYLHQFGDTAKMEKLNPED